ncbi:MULTISPECIES: helix-turn-helix domain-containing protein [Cryobacterium]|uniref:DNA-binding protein n=1 Tax=Cryobacterium breve TaxID=1259258 RepID=A0ABY2J6U7_9MICO|nr:MULTISPECIES: helix-turn-helix domain-containing protein [Cryobacterium]TFC92078.1 DNA-binding protein [Cryobacterium sp. TmT3-12]TFC99783.1 DNA-binding protein [Cryobacterium breve]
MSAVEAVRLYSVAAAATQLDMSRVWVYDQIKAGKLRVVEFGDTRPHQRIRADDLQKFIDARTFGPV